MGSRWGTAVLAGAIGLVLLPAGASADVFVPTRFDDPKPGKCRTHDCSLREALIAANADSHRDTVILSRGTYELEIPPGGTPFQSGALSIFNAVTVLGKGPGQTRIDANGLDSVISIGCGITAFGRVDLQDLTVTGGDAGGSPCQPQGGGIKAIGETGSKLVLTDVVVRGNEAEFGGGIFAYREKVHVKNSTIRGNTATEGGGLHIIAAPAATEVAIRASTISGNSASKGGGILADGSTFWGPNPPTVDLLNSTIAENQTTAEGGGIMADNNATVTLNNVTVAYNMADSDNTGGGVGGGIHQHSGAAFSLGDSVIGSNTVGSSGNGNQCAGAFTGLDGNLVQFQPGTACSISGDLVQPLDPLIGPLEDNGGPTKTIKLLSGSPAIGLAVSCPKRDQRGVPRPAEGCDSGAFERKGP